MSNRLTYFASVALATAALIVTGCTGVLNRAAEPDTSPPPTAKAAPLSIKPASYLGVYEPGAPRSYQGITTFGRDVGRIPNLALYYSGWGEPFRTQFASAAKAHGASVIVQIDPTSVSLSKVAQGDDDAYLREYADAVREFKLPVIIGFAHEMNGSWYTWGRNHTSPSIWISAWRHIVTLFRAEGADNVTWLWTINRLNQDIGSPARWWPGASYVTWIGIDGYFYAASDNFRTIFGPTLAAVRKFTRKPIILAETGVSPTANPVEQFPSLFSGVAQRQILGLVWFDESEHHNWRLESNPSDLALFRTEVIRFGLGARIR